MSKTRYNDHVPEMEAQAKYVTDVKPSRTKNIVAWFTANALDAATTSVGLQPTGVEGNPLPAFVLARFGVVAFWALKAFGTVILPVINVYVGKRWPYLENYAWKLLWFSTAVVVLVAGWNFYWIVR